MAPVWVERAPRAGLIFFAVRPAAGRDPLFRPREPVTSQGFANPDWLHAAHVGACLARSPLAVAAILEAGGPDFQEQVGRILGRSLFGELER